MGEAGMDGWYFWMKAAFCWLRWCVAAGHPAVRLQCFIKEVAIIKKSRRLPYCVFPRNGMRSGSIFVCTPTAT